MDYYVHHVPGRLRVKLPILKSRPEREHQIVQLFDDVEGIELVSANPLTGSLVIHYDAERIHSEDMLEILKDNGHLDDARIKKSQNLEHGAFSKTGQAVGKALFGWAVGKALENSGLSFLTVLI
jgi:hypothetical protein